MIVSEQFGDVYFSRHDGLAESRYVYLQGNGLPDAWVGRARFCIGELGFGTGLNVLAAWKLFDETADKHARLDIVSVEKYPLKAERIAEVLEPWRDELGVYLDRLLAVYPMITPGFHRIHLSDRVTLNLVFDDVIEALDGIDASVDAWFLDGFAPAKNPEMWTPQVFAQVARLSTKGASFATFSAARVVRDGLGAAGFDVQKIKGFKYKPDMLVGRYAGAGRLPVNVPARVAVMGAGLAGASAAWHLKRAGVDVHVFEAGAEIGAGASGNRLGLINPKLTFYRMPHTDVHVAGYDYSVRLLRELDGVGFSAKGNLQLELDADKTRRFNGYLANLGWDKAHMTRVDAQEASDIAGVRVDVPAMYYPQGASACPKAVCEVMLAGIPVMFGVSAPPDGFDAVVYATGAGDALGMGLQVVRGQVTRLVANDVSANLRVNFGFGGYLSPAHDGEHMCGATFVPNSTDCAIREADHEYNIMMIKNALPVFADVNWQVAGGWAGVRVATKDRYPVIGRAGDAWVNTAHGSHGLVTGILGGALIAAQITGGVLPLSRTCVDALGVDRAGVKL